MPGFFSTVGVRLLAGREFTEADTGSPSGSSYASYGTRVVVNETFVKRFFASPADAIGRRIGFGGTDADLDVEIVGVVEDVKGVDLKEASWLASDLHLCADIGHLRSIALEKNGHSCALTR